MSHFVTLVLVPPDTPKEEIPSLVDSMLEPFSEYLEVEPYETPCFCIGLQARKEVEEKVNAKYDIEALRKAFHSLPEKKRTDKKWDKMIAPRTKLRKQLLDTHPLKDKPNPLCKVCKGSGTRISHANPNGKTDWWVCGGRWNGYLFGPEHEEACRDKEGGFNFGDEHQKLENNCRRVSEIPIDDPYYVPFAILTPEGEWVEQGAMGWFAVVSNETPDDQWHETVKAVLAKYPEHLAVAVDCHI